MAYECLRHPVDIGCVLGSDACASAFSRSSPQFAELVHGKLWRVSKWVAWACGVPTALPCFATKSWSDHEHQLMSGRIWLCWHISIGGSFSKCGEMIIENFGPCLTRHNTSTFLARNCLDARHSMDSSCWTVNSGFNLTKTCEGHVGETCYFLGQERITTKSYPRMNVGYPANESFWAAYFVPQSAAKN